MQEIVENVPQFLLNMLNEQYGCELTKKIINGYQIKRKVTFRVNTLKSNITEIEEELKNKQIEFEKMDFFPNAIVIKNVLEKDLQELEIYKER